METEAVAMLRRMTAVAEANLGSKHAVAVEARDMLAECVEAMGRAQAPPASDDATSVAAPS